MIRASALAFGSMVAVLSMTAACKVDVTSKTRYTESNVTRSDTIAWTGEAIQINIAEPGVLVNGGIGVTSDPGVTMVNANSRVLAMATTDHKADADLSIIDIKAGFTITHNGVGPTGTIIIACGHPPTHGDSDGGEAGCELTNVVVPTGNATTPLHLTVLSGNGAVTLNMGGAYLGGGAGAPNGQQKAGLQVGAGGAGCDITATLPANLGGVISILSQKAGDITATLPTSFSADVVTIENDPGKLAVGPFTDITNVGGGKSQARGTPGIGLASLNLNSAQDVGSSGQITLIGN